MRASSPERPQRSTCLTANFRYRAEEDEVDIAPLTACLTSSAASLCVQTANAGAKPASAADGRPVHKAAQQSKEAEEPASNLPADRETCQDGAAAVEFQVSVKELASRFTQATNELQLMGIVKAATSKRRGSFAQRLVWGTGRVTGGSIAAV